MKYLVASAAAGWCYQCDSRTAGCQIVVDAEMMAYHKIPCSGQCYVRVKDGRMFTHSSSLFFELSPSLVMSRGCSWEHGFMTNQASYTPLFEQEAMWLFCDTAL